MNLYKSLKRIDEINDLNLGEKEALLKLQKRILKTQLEDNESYQIAKQGTSLEQQLEKLSEKNNIFRRLMPRRKNEEYNKLVTSIGEAIGEIPTQLYCKGIFQYDNILAPVIHTARTISPIALLLPLIDPEFNYSNSQDMSLLAVFGVLTFSLYTSISGIKMLENKKFGRVPIEKAKYIDQKINSLF